MTLAVLRHPWIDTRRAPLYVWRIPGAATDDELADCLEARERWAAVNTEKFAWVVDAMSMRGATPRQRVMMGEHLARLQDFNRRLNVGCALIVTNPLVRGFVTAVFWVSPPTFPHRFFSSWDQGEAWALAQLQAAGVTVQDERVAEDCALGTDTAPTDAPPR